MTGRQQFSCDPVAWNNAGMTAPNARRTLVWICPRPCTSSGLCPGSRQHARDLRGAPGPARARGRDVPPRQLRRNLAQRRATRLQLPDGWNQISRVSGSLVPPHRTRGDAERCSHPIPKPPPKFRPPPEGKVRPFHPILKPLGFRMILRPGAPLRCRHILVYPGVTLPGEGFRRA